MQPFVSSLAGRAHPILVLAIILKTTMHFTYLSTTAAAAFLVSTITVCAVPVYDITTSSGFHNSVREGRVDVFRRKDSQPIFFESHRKWPLSPAVKKAPLPKVKTTVKTSSADAQKHPKGHPIDSGTKVSVTFWRMKKYHDNLANEELWEGINMNIPDAPCSHAQTKDFEIKIEATHQGSQCRS
ncbi:hypothetical protein BT96DRAFT_409304 [Gymnopus androsaceus JB14]|uniref:Uncharacterized protein n=1 Tax=Gymnopus androsaceus JB14 TaxID=1447944 RepID=A0A6A4GTV3_9AGAR|nr:hypothetical protein BT96DRAFT_409304 [Gymnopus androsaceus JB14]